MLLGLQNIGGWSGLKASVPIRAYMHEWKGVMHASTNPMGIEIIGLGMGLGFVLGSGYWCTDFLVIQTAMASKNMESARRVPLIAAVPKMLFPFLVICLGCWRSALPTPHTTTVVRNENGVIFHEITGGATGGREGTGLVPAKINPVTGKAMLDGQRPAAARLRHGHAEHAAALFPDRHSRTGTDGAAGKFHEWHGGQRDGFQYRLHLRPLSVVHPQGRQRPALHGRGSMGHGRRHTAVDCTAYAAINFNNIMDTLQLVFSFVNAPLFATFLLGMFWKRATGHARICRADFWHCGGDAASRADAADQAHTGIHGGWITVVHHYPSDMAQNFWGATSPSVPTSLSR